MKAEKIKDFIKVIDTWVEVSDERLKKDLRGKNYSSASERQAFINGMEQAKELFVKMFYK